MLSFTILRGHPEPLVLQGFPSDALATTLASDNSLVSPLYAPHGDFSRIYGICSAATLEILSDMHTLTQAYLARWNHMGNTNPTSNARVASYDAQLQHLYSRLLRRPSSEDDAIPDWVYESCRLAALIYCRSIVHGASLADSASTLHARSSSPDMTGTTLLDALHGALLQTDMRSCWGALRGVFLWVCLVGGAASWPSMHFTSIEENEETLLAQAWSRKCFALYAIRAAVSVSFDQASAVIQGLRTMLHVRHWMNIATRA
jgi:hypothetical protein